MARQLADDPARIVAAQADWMGDPDSGWRMPVDWRYHTWRIIAMLVPLLTAVIWLVIPLGLYLAAIVAVSVRWVGRRIPLMPALKWVYGGAIAAVALLATILVRSVTMWLLPMPWWLGILAGPLAAVLVAKRIEGYVDYNRPLRYWATTLRAVLSAPRARRAPATYELPSPAVADEGADLTPYHLAALMLDPDKEPDMPRFISRESVQAVQWIPEDDAAGAAAIFELAKAGVAVRVVTDPASQGPDVLDLGDDLVASARHYVLLQPMDDGLHVSVVPPGVFERQYMPAPEPRKPGVREAQAPDTRVAVAIEDDAELAATPRRGGLGARRA